MCRASHYAAAWSIREKLCCTRRINWHYSDAGPNTSESKSQFPRTAQAERSITSNILLSPRAKEVSYAWLYKSPPSGRLGDEAATFFRNARLRSLFASLCFRWRWNRALSPLIADIVTKRSRPGSTRHRSGRQL
jgi:hypothetical protein